MSISDPQLCWLHEDGEPDHTIITGERVGVRFAIDGVVQPDVLPAPASRECAVRNGVEPGRIVEGYDGPWR